MEIEIRCPKTEQEWTQYYDLRYRILRQPWNQPLGSERNEGDARGQHFALFQNGKIMAIARLDIQEKEGQVRFMAVETEVQGSGYGKRVMQQIENESRNLQLRRLVLHAREIALPFYTKLGYQLLEKSHLLFNEIQHYFMEKRLPYSINEADKSFFVNLLGSRAKYEEAMCIAYGSDHTEDFVFPPSIVLQPESAEEVSKILHYCNENSIPVTPAGARTGLSGGALAIYGGVLLSSERLNRILHIDEKNHQVTTEPGVITQVLQDAVREKGLFYPPDPASKGSCFIGGNIAENSGGPKAVKYGVTKDYVLNLEVVLPNGEIIWTGANVLKNATGYNLTQLIVGSEGTLGFVTKIVLRLLPHPTQNLLLLVPFFNLRTACEAVAAIFQAGITPSGLEFMERDAILYAQEFTGDKSLVINEKHQAHLLIEVDGFEGDQLMNEVEKIVEVLSNYETDEILFADSEAQKNALWNLRRKVGEAVKAQSVYKEEDTVVPRFQLPDLITEVKRLGQQYHFHSVCYGHAGDGNLHVNILKGNLTDEAWNNEIPKAIGELFQRVVELGGTISGEHGIGLVQKPYMSIAFPEVTLQIMRSIKNVFDPKGILNPGKIF